MGGADMNDDEKLQEYDRKLFTGIVECVRWCLDEDILRVSQLEKMKHNSREWEKYLERGRGVFESAFTKDT